MSIIKMNKLKSVIALTGAISMATAAGLAIAAVTPEERAKIGIEGTELTAAGAIRAGNAEGTIPAWKNEPIVPPAGFKPGTFHPDPFAGDAVLFKITAQNFQEYGDKLSEGQKLMFQTYPDFYMNVYPTRRSVVYKPYIYEAAMKNLDRAELDPAPDVGMGIVGFKGARKAWAFPIPHSGDEAIINQSTKPVNPWMESWETTLAITPSGDYVVNKLNVQQHQAWSDPEIADEAFDPNLNNMQYYQTLTAPPKLAGQVVLARDPATFNQRFRAAWAYSPGQRRVKRAPQIVYDNPLTASDGMATTDQKFGFNGPNDRFSYKLLGRKEMYVPYNAYRLWAKDATPDKVITKTGKLDQEYARYELHRVWVLEATLKEGTSHDYGKRVFYLDEDSWWIVAMDGYDRRMSPWRYWESHNVMFYDVGFFHPITDIQYDMNAGRMLALMFDKEKAPDFAWRAEDKYFTPSSVRRNGIR